MILVTRPSRDYELLDSGEGEKLERYGKIILSRPDPQALWPKHLPAKEWSKAQAVFERDAKDARWHIKSGLPSRWVVEFSNLKFLIRPTAFKHTGLFPEQMDNWDWTRDLIKHAPRKISVLNLFGYTGGATLAAAAAGAEVCHVDGSKVATAWARENAELSGLAERPIRWIVDDVRAFLRREIKRGHKYDGIIMDPPAFGHGAKKELWKIEDDFLGLIELCQAALSRQPLFVLINGYAAGYSSITYANNLQMMMQNHRGTIEMGELAIAETGSERLLPAGIFARWHD